MELSITVSGHTFSITTDSAGDGSRRYVFQLSGESNNMTLNQQQLVEVLEYCKLAIERQKRGLEP